MEKLDESRTRRDEKGRKYNKMDKRANDKLVRSPEQNGGRYGRDETRRRGRPRERMERGSRNRSSSAGSEKMERVGDRWGKMEGYCSTGQSPQWAAVPMEEEEV